VSYWTTFTDGPKAGQRMAIKYAMDIKMAFVMPMTVEWVAEDDEPRVPAPRFVTGTYKYVGRDSYGWLTFTWEEAPERLQHPEALLQEHQRLATQRT